MLPRYFLRCNDVLLLSLMQPRSASSVTFFAPLRNCPPRQAKEGERNGRKNENSPPLLLLSALCFFLPFSLLLARQVDANRFHSPPRSNPCELISKLTLTWQEASLHWRRRKSGYLDASAPCESKQSIWRPPNSKKHTPV